MTHALLAGGVAFLIALLAGTQVVPWLQRRKLGKAISEDGPSSHMSKAGTPTMGGILIFGAVAVVTIASNLSARHSIFLPLGVVTATMAIGAYDDLGTLVGGKQRKLSWRAKFVLLVALSAVVACVLYFGLDAHSVNIPWGGKHDLGYIYLPIAFAIVFLMTPATAITDGLDGLLGGTAAVAYAAYGVIAFVQGQEYLGTFSFTVVGALLGFLWYNAHPASVFMGDAGALPLGGALATVALMTGHWLLLPLIGVVFVAEAASTVIQIAYFQTTGGQRLFRMTPLHHHFELIGWSEPQVVMRFWLFGIVAGMVGVGLALAV
ncbi:MAG: phospho-N-acetylmuramoyl-pentapeptide-transferase [Dehalococcoidia bacterium]|nr:phospho-N-acetylmuramoyl-pentapeptide-transferase [Dehalococcoidia bacterium]